MATLALSAFATSEPTSLSGNDVAKDEDKVIKISSSVQDADVISPLAENDVVYLLDGKKASNDEVRNLPTLDIASMTVIKNAEVSKSLGHAGKTVIAIETKTKLDTLKVNIVENPACNAQFKGGDMALMQWLRKNVRYPQVSQSLGVQGKITVQFYVSETGRIFNVRAISIDKNEPQSGQTLEELIVQAYAKDMAKLGKTLSAEETKAHKVAVMALVKEAERVVREMPAWEPAFIDKDKTKPCTVKFAMPIMFRLG
jgi:protein TonB